MNIPRPAPAARRALAVLPHRPGVYMFRDRSGKVVYVGRSRDLAARARSYWTHLGDRPHLARMVSRVEWVEPVVCASEHEAAFLESDLLERHPTRYNRTLGMESCVWLRLDANRRRPDLTVVHDPAPRDGARWFGPYLGWEPARQGAVGLLRLYPIRFAGTDISRADRELAVSLGVASPDVVTLAGSIESVLKRDPSAVAHAFTLLEEARDRAADSLMFERAQAIQEQIRGLRWIVEPQKLAGLDPLDCDFSAVARAGAAAVRVVLSLRGGRLWQRHVHRLHPSSGGPPGGDASTHEADSPGRDWADLAAENATLMARLAAVDEIGPLAWRQ